MARAFIPAIEKTIKLQKWDPSGDTWVTIKQAAAREQHRYEEETWARELQYEQAGGPITERTKPSLVKIWLSRAKLTFVDCSIVEAVLDENGLPITDDKTKEVKTKPMFHRGMSELAFTTAWQRLPVELVEEWDEAVLKLNPHWAGREFQCPECGYTGSMNVVNSEDMLGEG